MTYLELRIQENTPAARNIEAFAEAQHVSPEEAALKLLASLPFAKRSANIATNRRAAIEALSGSFKDSAWIGENLNAEKRADIDRENARDLI